MSLETKIQTCGPHLNRVEKGLGQWLSGQSVRVQVQGPEFNP